MTSRVALLVALVAWGPGPAAAQDLDRVSWGRVLRDALAPALPFPDATRAGTPEDGGSEVVWTVRWPAADGQVAEVVANPLHPRNRERALEAEQEIQRAAMVSQRNSQGDYERALGDFQRTGEVHSEVREITLRDDGVAGERYDAESQLTVRIERRAGRFQAAVESALELSVGTTAAAEAAVIRVSAHEYGEPLRYCAEQAWLVFGPATPTISRVSPEEAGIDIVATEDEGDWVLVTVSGNAELVAQVLARAHWATVATVVTPAPRGR
jgi:hypothetical protein